MSSPHRQLDRLGWTYTGLNIAWNVVLAGGIIFLWRHRQLPALRMRKLPLLFIGVLSLHIFGSLNLFAYPFGSYFTCTNEFWWMSIYLPLGVALFQAANTQFLHHASRQKQFAHVSRLGEHEPIDMDRAKELSNSRWKRTVANLRHASRVRRTLICIALGVAVQFGVDLIVYFGSRKFHPSYGLFKGSPGCVQGWEFWFSLVWQLFWTWIYAPYILWKSRGHKDVHGWRLQTICCCLAGLPATPLWLAGLYAPKFAHVNAVFPPQLWFSLCIFLIEVSALGFPIIDTLKGNSLRQETLEAIANWEARQAVINADSGISAHGSLKGSTALSTATTLKPAGEGNISKPAGEGGTTQMSFDSQRSDMLTMTALENALRSNARPLLEFAALKDFSGENISFLTHIADWRREWLTSQEATAKRRRNQFIAAARIYAHFISLEFSEFPINISSKEMKRLHAVFEPAAILLSRGKRGSVDSSTSDSVTPFDNVPPDQRPWTAYDGNSSHGSEVELKTGMTLDSLGQANLKAVSQIRDISLESFADIEIPEIFSEIVFESAESEIKYLVLTNTWPKFVTVTRANSQTSKDDDEEKGKVFLSKLSCF